MVLVAGVLVGGSAGRGQTSISQQGHASARAGNELVDYRLIVTTPELVRSHRPRREVVTIRRPWASTEDLAWEGVRTNVFLAQL
jgi:hypothetical protein